MTDYVVTAGISAGYPSAHLGGHHVTGSGIMTFCEPGADLKAVDARVMAMPNSPVALIRTGRICVGEELFGVTVGRRENDAIGFSAKTVRSHDLYNGKARWSVIQPTSSRTLSTWNFTDIDAWVDAHYEADRDIVFTFYGTPTWASARPTEEGVYGPSNLGLQAEPATMADWSFFCTTIATRYLGKIKYYEVWNEPNRYNDGTGPTAAGVSNKRFFFSGTFAKLAEMTRLANQAIKAVDPTAKIISSPITDWVATAAGAQETYFTGMMDAATGDGSTKMKDWVDIIGVHLYLANNNALALAGMIDRVNAAKVTAGVTTKETWDTESGPIEVHAADMTTAQVERYLTRFFVTLAAKGVKRSIYYALDNTTMGFVGREDVYAAWDRARELVLSGRITAVSRLFDGRICYWVGDSPTIA